MVPTTSAGSRSGVNWMREKLASRISDRVRTARVLARPGTPSSRICPPVRSPTNNRSTMGLCPTIRRPISSNALAISAACGAVVSVALATGDGIALRDGSGWGQRYQPVEGGGLDGGERTPIAHRQITQADGAVAEPGQ